MTLAEDLANPPRVGRLDTNVKNTVRVLTIDIEWRPILSYHWGLWDQNIGITQIVDDGGMLCFAAKWYGSKEILFYSEHADGHAAMVQKAHELLSEADVLVTYNGDKYDIRKLNQEFMLAGMAPPRPFKSIDLVKTNKSRFDLPSRKLDYLVQRSGVGKKVKHQGFELWTDCMAGDPAAWALMERYNRMDVIVTEKALLRLLPWLVNSPHWGMFTRDEFSCPYCGAKKLDRKGETHTLVQSYALYECRGCGGWARGMRRLQDPTHTRAIR